MATPSHDVRATLGYYLPKADGSPPDVDDFSIVLGSTDMDSQEVFIKNVRGNQDLYTLDEHGFKFVKHTSSLSDFTDDEAIKSVYYPEIEELLIKSTGAKKVFFFNHLIRSNASALVEEGSYLTGAPGPAPRVHMDQTPKGAGQLLFRILSEDDAAEAVAGRWQIINAWKPLKTIQKDPFAVTDATTVSESNQVAMKRVYADGKDGENCTITANGVSQHKWYYMYEQQPDEILLFKQHESDPNVKAKGVPHSAFVYPGTEHLENRISIEVRAVVVY